MSNPVFRYGCLTSGEAGSAQLDAAELPDPQVGQELVLQGEEGRHAATVQRLQPGQELDLVNGSGVRWSAQVKSVGKDRLTCQVIARTQEPASAPQIVLVQAIAKAGRDEQAIEAAVECGVDEVWAWQAARSIAVWHPERIAKAKQKWHNQIVAATKQSRRAWLAPVFGPYQSKDLVKEIHKVLHQGGSALVLHEQSTLPLAEAALPQPGTNAKILVIVGPEGGISQEELDLFTQVGAQSVRLGPHVMRTSSAGPVAIAILAQSLGRWG